MENTLQVLKKDITKANVDDFANKMISQIENGEINILEAFAQIKVLEKVFDKVKTALKDDLVEAASSCNNNEKYFGAEFKVSMKGVRYDFSQCGHSKLNRYKQQIKELTEKCKPIEEALKKADKVTVIDDETGEICCLPTKSGSESVEIKL